MYVLLREAGEVWWLLGEAGMGRGGYRTGSINEFEELGSDQIV